MDSLPPLVADNLHWIALIASILILTTALARHKQRRQKKLVKVLKRHGVLDNQQRFQNP